MIKIDLFLSSDFNINTAEDKISIKKSIKCISSDFNILWLIAYITLYINVSDFESRFIGALTILLVLAGLLKKS